MLFFKALVKKTQKLKYRVLRYKLLFWNSIQSVLILSETHSLDYNADSWVVAEISALHKHMVYDSSTMFSFFEYYDSSASFLRIKEMTVDFETFPSTIRSFDVIKNEFSRVKFDLRYKKETERFFKNKKNIFFSFNKKFYTKVNLVFIQHKKRLFNFDHEKQILKEKNTWKNKKHFKKNVYKFNKRFFKKSIKKLYFKKPMAHCTGKNF